MQDIASCTSMPSFSVAVMTASTAAFRVGRPKEPRASATFRKLRTAPRPVDLTDILQGTCKTHSIFDICCHSFADGAAEAAALHLNASRPRQEAELCKHQGSSFASTEQLRESDGGDPRRSFVERKGRLRGVFRSSGTHTTWSRCRQACIESHDVNTS